jgi:hypothetical protein
MPSHFQSWKPFGIPKGLLKRVTRFLETLWNSKGHAKYGYTFWEKIRNLKCALKANPKT